ncbi:MAG TPA: DNA adenine methylase [Planctomycetota bacterium]
MPIKYLGSKRVLVPRIVALVRELAPPGATVLDLFSGTARVGHALKGAGYRVLANDVHAYAATIARTYVQADAERWQDQAAAWLADLQRLPGAAGWFTRDYCERSRFFQPANGARIEAIRNAIAAAALHPELEAVLLTSLMEAADRVDSTTGVQMAYLKQWAQRAGNDLELRVPELLPGVAAGPCRATQLDAREAAATLQADIAYLDPPYNQHSYLGNYHVWETLVRWDAPEVYGIACKRLDCRERRSDFNSKRRFLDAWRDTLAAVRAERLIVSFSNEGFVTREEMEALLRKRGEVAVIACDHPRYVGARIGIHNPQGERVGRVSHVRNTEYLFVVTPDSVPALAAGADL